MNGAVMYKPFAAVLGSAFLAWVGAARLVRRRLTDATPSHRLSTATVERRDERIGLVFSENFATHPGPLGFMLADGHREILLGGPEPHASGAWRPLLNGCLPAGLEEVCGSFSGHLGSTPDDFGLQFEEFTHAGELVWSVQPSMPGATGPAGPVVAIHVHGLGSGRSQTLRSVDTFSKLGVPSLVSTYRTSTDHGRKASKFSSLGVDESSRLREMHQLALDMGAEKIVYVGWSLGASIILNFLNRWAPTNVAGVVLVSPALYWKGMLIAHLHRTGIPRGISRVLAWSADRLRFPWEPRLFNLSEEICLKPSIDVPLLVFHGTADQTVPIEFSYDFMANNGNHVELVEFPNAHHTLEWNANTRKWTHSITQWCRHWGIIGGREPTRRVGLDG